MLRWHLVLTFAVATLSFNDANSANATLPTSSTSSPPSTLSILSTPSTLPSSLSPNLPSDADVLALDVDALPSLCQCLTMNDTIGQNELRCASRLDEEARSVALKDLLAWQCQFVTIDISHVELTYVAADAFVSSPDLRVVYLHSDYIENVDGEAFRGLNALVDVDLSDNSLLSVDPRMFVTNVQLKTVSLADNPLVELKPNAPILESDSITSLDLSFCKLKTLTKESFAKLPSLQHLDLSSNDIQYLPMAALQSMTSLNALNIGNNRWSCDCAFKEVVEFAKTMEVTESRVRCYGPGRTMEYWSEKSAQKYCPDRAVGGLVIETKEEENANGMMKGGDEGSAEYDGDVDLQSFDDLQQDTDDLRQAMNELVDDDAVTVVVDDMVIVIEGTDTDAEADAEADADAYVVPAAVLVFVMAALIVFCLGVSVALCRTLIRRDPGRQGWDELDEEGDGDIVYKKVPLK